MKKEYYLILGITAVLCGFFAAFIVSGQQASQTDALSFSNLTFKIAPTRETFLPMEPITLKISLSNNTTSPILGHSNIDFNGLHIELFVTNQQGVKMEINSLPTDRASFERIKNEPIQPNQHFEITDVFYTLHHYFPDPGTYTLEATFIDATGQQKIKSEPATIKIVEPTGRDRAAYNLLKTKPVRPFFFAGDTEGDDGFKHLENIANQFGDTTYGDYAAYVAARKYRFRRDNVRAKAMLQRLLSKPNFVFKEDVKRLLQEIENLPQPQ